MSFKKDQLRYFVTVAEEGQMTRAARRLSIAQPALSQAISQLESELGFRLLERHPRGVSLTAAGGTFLAKAQAVVQSEDTVRQTGESLARAARRVLSVGFIGPPPSLVVPELFAALTRSHPDAELTFRDLSFPTGRTAQWLADVDVAICHEPDPDDDIVCIPLSAPRRVLMVRRDHRLAERDRVQLAEALDERFISYSPTVQPLWAGFHSLDDHRGEPPARSSSDHVASALQMLGLLGVTAAVSTLPETDARIVASVLPNVAVVPLVDADPVRISLVRHAETTHPLLSTLVQAAEDLRTAARQ